LDSPFLPKPINCALFYSTKTDGESGLGSPKPQDDR
jgi:hypothetical protein